MKLKTNENITLYYCCRYYLPLNVMIQVIFQVMYYSCIGLWNNSGFPFSIDQKAGHLYLILKFLAFGFFPPISLVIVFFCDSSRVEHECLNALTETPGEPNMEIILSGRMTFAIHKTLRFTLCKYFYSENDLIWV